MQHSLGEQLKEKGENGKARKKERWGGGGEEKASLHRRKLIGRRNSTFLQCKRQNKYVCNIYSTCLKTGRIWYSDGLFGFGYQTSGFWLLFRQIAQPRPRFSEKVSENRLPEHLIFGQIRFLVVWFSDIYLSLKKN